MGGLCCTLIWGNLHYLGRKLDSTPNMGIVEALEGLGLGNASVKGLGVWGLGFRDL